MFIVIRKQNLIVSISLVLVFVILLIAGCFILFSKSSTNLASKGEHNYFILIHVDKKKLYLCENNACVKTYPIATGKPGWPSPIGNWKIINKGDWGEGFGGRWMGLNVTWGKYGIHGTTREDTIGSAASHGCIRMRNKDVKELYKLVPIGTPVIISNGPFGPFGLGFKELTPGDRGADVLAVQQKLKFLGYFTGHESGIYEDDLKYALHKFQKANGLKVKDAITREDYHAMGFKEFE